MKLNRTGVAQHNKQRLGTGRAQATKLKRFTGLTTKLKINLYKTLIRSVIEYPVIPMCLMPKSSKLQWQQFQNKYIREAARGANPDQNLTIAQLHEKYNVEAINIRLRRLATRVWDKMQDIDPEIIRESNTTGLMPNLKDHSWWPRISHYMNEEDELPKYTKEDYME